MRDRPINLRDWQVKAALDGRLSALVVPVPVHRFAGHLRGYSATGRVKAYYGDHRLGLEFVDDQRGLWHPEDNPDGASAWYVPLPLTVGDRYWAREAHALLSRTAYRASIGTGTIQQVEHPTDGYSAAVFREGFDRSGAPRWRSSTQLPRWASRLTIIPTSVRVCRVQDVTEDEALAAGVTKVRDACHVIKGFDYDLAGLCHTSATTPFAKWWNSVHGPDAWERNTWVCIARVTTHALNIDSMGD
jgi:hypothetical protein